MRLGRLIAAVWIGLLATPASVTAATATVVPDPSAESADLVLYRAAPGERNDVTATVELLDGQEVWTLTDSAATVTAGIPCVSVDVHTVRCPPRPSRSINAADVDLGDLDDQFLWAPRGSESIFGVVIANGGAGDDRLGGQTSVNVVRGGPGADVLRSGEFSEVNDLNGGPGNDRLIGGPGFDELNGGGGRDELYGGGQHDLMTDGDRDGAPGDAGPGPDLFVGGSGGCCLIMPGDRVSYRGRTEPVIVDLADDAPDGEAGEGDVLVGIESVEGGRGADRLLGDRRANVLIGRLGRDRLSGRDGKDWLVPGPGGGRLFCGAGLDAAGPTSARDLLAGDCEVLDASDEGLSSDVHPRSGGPGRLSYTVSCPENGSDEGGLYRRCRGTLHIREAHRGRRLLGFGSFPPGEWSEREFTVRLTPLGRRLHGRVEATLRLAMRTDAGPRAVRWSIALVLGR